MNCNLSHIELMLSCRHRDKQLMMEESVNERLSKSLLTYMNELDDGCDYVVTKNELNVLKKL